MGPGMAIAGITKLHALLSPVRSNISFSLVRLRPILLASFFQGALSIEVVDAPVASN